ncbi:dynein intermediate chain 3, ciliary-like [Rhopalosiphum maidis]|uniref:dynein intermediate chain 3, ciliary-like n=1 Tax=Rhopalosiphum maidis TaxID=43146 RepID=UPI000EFE41EE|nr:dynein intermediate chain 3, ciliary-like [Rhopalosiphum maidis]
MYTYEKKRSDYGRQCRFHNTGPTIMIDMMTDLSLEDNWIQRNPVDKTTNETTKWSEHEANTIRVKYVNRGISHREGGWPVDVNLDDPEQVSRFKRKAEKDKLYLESVKTVSVLTEHFIRQNNAINIFQPYFTDPKTKEFRTQVPSHRTVAILLDPCDSARPVRNISWSSENSTHLAISYSEMRFQMDDPNNSPNSYVFDTEMFTFPYFTMESPCPITNIKFHHRDGQLLAGGLMNGQVALWDMRNSYKNIGISEIRNGHNDSVLSLQWIQSKTNSEFMTASRDGQIIWWDTRNLKEPTDKLVLDLLRNEAHGEPEWIQSGRTDGATCLEYNFSIPIRFVIGTSHGKVFDGNRKGKTVTEKITYTYKCHPGSIRSLRRNPGYLKNFLTVCNWQATIWSEDVKESFIMCTKHHNVRLTDGQWSNSKNSVFYLTRYDGFMECWDILQNQQHPILSIKLTDKKLNCITCHEDGALLAVGDDCGKTRVVEMNDWFVTPGPYDRVRLTTMFERQSRLEKIREGKLREQKTKINFKSTDNNDDSLKKSELFRTAAVDGDISELIEKACHGSLNEMTEDDVTEEVKSEEFTTEE